ncbi:MAG TPA: putative metallopeptidase, partial [Candidatus Micrarchaeota archaeon]|nr:putative metallopeptidase [Candidatus Micrarchaeota archaeon]
VFYLDVEVAPDITERLEDIVSTLELGHINQFRIIAMRSRHTTARAYARIWNLPDIWQKALGVGAFYVIEVLSEHFDPLSHEEQTRVLIHELMHIPKTFSGALMPHHHIGGDIDRKTVDKVFKKYLDMKNKSLGIGVSNWRFKPGVRA